MCHPHVVVMSRHVARFVGLIYQSDTSTVGRSDVFATWAAGVWVADELETSLAAAKPCESRAVQGRDAEAQHQTDASESEPERI